MLNKRADNWWD